MDARVQGGEDSFISCNVTQKNENKTQGMKSMLLLSQKQHRALSRGNKSWALSFFSRGLPAISAVPFSFFLFNLLILFIALSLWLQERHTHTHIRTHTVILIQQHTNDFTYSHQTLSAKMRPSVAKCSIKLGAKAGLTVANLRQYFSNQLSASCGCSLTIWLSRNTITRLLSVVGIVQILLG